MEIKTKRFLVSSKKAFIEFIQILLGTAIMAIGTALFLLPNKLSAGGFSGIATIFYYLFELPIGTTTLLLNIPLFLFAFLKLGKKFFMRSIAGTISLSFFLDLFENFEGLTQDRLLACIYGGILIGIGTAIILKVNASTGGSDLLAQIIKKYKPEFRTGNLIVLLDVIVVTLNVLVFKQIEIALYSAISIYIMGKVIDIFLEGIYFTKLLYIVSEKYEKIAQRIGDEVERGTTGLYAKGMYTNDEKMLLLCAVSRGEVAKIQRIIKEEDPKAFLIISNAREVFGKGFKK